MPHLRAREQRLLRAAVRPHAGQPVVDAGGAHELAVAPGGLRRGAVAVGLHEVEGREAGGHHDPHRAVGVLPGGQRAAVHDPVVGHGRRRRVGEVEGDDVGPGVGRAGRAGTSGRSRRPPATPSPGRARRPTTTTRSPWSSSSGRTSVGPGSGVRDSSTGALAGDVGDHQGPAGDAHDEGPVGLRDVGLVDVRLLGVRAGAAAADGARGVREAAASDRSASIGTTGPPPKP